MTANWQHPDINLQKISATNINLQTVYDDKCIDKCGVVHVVHPYFIILNRWIVLKVPHPFGHSLTHCHFRILDPDLDPDPDPDPGPALDYPDHHNQPAHPDHHVYPDPDQ